MQKLSRISSGKNNKSCRIFHRESKKISFAFFRFFYDFLRNLQETGKSLYYWSYPFAGKPSERICLLQCGPWAAGRRGLLDSGELAAGLGQGRAGEESMGH
jgi:hypothetical protein